MSTAIGYIRVSSEQQAGEKQTSLNDQRTAIAVRADALGLLLGAVFEDAGISGATVAKRPGLTALIAYCEAHKRTVSDTGVVLVLNDSRFGRFDDPDEAAALRFNLKRCGWIVRFCEADDIQDPSIRHIMRAVGGAQASEYRRNLRANSTRGRHGTVRQGYWASREPFGYRRLVVYPELQSRVLEHGQAKARGEKIKLTQGPDDEVRIVREVFRRYAAGTHSMKALCRWLNTESSATSGRQPWAGTTVRHMLENMAYLGAIAARRRTATRMDAGDYTRTAPEYVIWNAHPPLIDQETFDQCQRMLTEIPPRGETFDYRVRGLVRCETCGEHLTGGGLGSRLASTGQRVRFYICAGGREGRCAPKATCVTSHLLEDAIITAITEHLAQQVTPAQIRRAFGERLGGQTPKPAKTSAKLRSDLISRRDRLVSAIESGTLTAQEAHARLDALRTQLSALEEGPAAPSVVPTEAVLDRLVARAKNVMTLAANSTGAELRALIRPWVDDMTFDKSNRMLTLHLRTMSTGLLAQPLLAANLREQTCVVRVPVTRRA
jgi:DNA invertase Pin-like site-specific DNA recombinase